MAAAGAGSTRPPMPPNPFSWAELNAICERYDSLGVKASGGVGDNACGAWIEAELVRAGFIVERQNFAVPYFEQATASLSVGEASAPVLPVAIVVPTEPAGVSGRLVLRAPWSREERCDGAIAIVLLPYRRWSAASSPEVRKPVQAAIAAGAAAVVIVTTGPSGEGLALNVPAGGGLFARPTVVLAPKAANVFLQAAERRETARLVVRGRGGQRPAFNLIGHRQAPGPELRRGPELVLSTPRSGWFTCTGERGPGLAAWLVLARWAASRPGLNVTVLCTSGHEYDNAGGLLFLEHKAPKPEHTALWVHLGANVATRDWRDLGIDSRIAPQRRSAALPSNHARLADGGAAGFCRTAGP